MFKEGEEIKEGISTIPTRSLIEGHVPYTSPKGEFSYAEEKTREGVSKNSLQGEGKSKAHFPSATNMTMRKKSISTKD